MWSNRQVRRVEGRGRRTVGRARHPGIAYHGRLGQSTSSDGLVETASVREVLDAIEQLDLESSWDDAAPSLRPILPRRRELPPMPGELPARDYPPGIRVGLGLDIGPAMLFVSDEQLTQWAVTPQAAFERAEGNVRACVAGKRQFGLILESLDGVPTKVFQSREGWASCLLLTPDELCRVLGERSGLVLAPMRDVIMWLPLDAAAELCERILERFAEVDMNALAIPPMTLVDGRLGWLHPVPGSDGTARLPH